jgi:hypothetical protein
MSARTIDYLPGAGGQIHTGLGQGLLYRGFDLAGRETRGAFSHFLIVFRDRLVSLAISLIDVPCLNRIDRILLINPMVMTPCSLLHKKAAG